MTRFGGRFVFPDLDAEPLGEASFDETLRADDVLPAEVLRALHRAARLT